MSIKDGDDPAAVQAYLKQYPDGAFAALARQRLASVSKAPRALTPTKFDGTWDVTVDCPAHQAAAGYKWRFQAEVKDGVLAGQYGVAGNPSSMVLKGRIRADGTATLDAKGMVGDPKFTANRLSRGTNYSYRVDARFEDMSGSGQRIEARPCTLTFVK
jgi:hypothetical protein